MDDSLIALSLSADGCWALALDAHPAHGKNKAQVGAS